MEQYFTIVILAFFALWVFGLWFIWSRPAIKIKESTQSKLTLNIYPVIFRIIAGNHQLLGVILLLFPIVATPQITTLTCEPVFQSSSLEKIELTSNIVECEIEEIGWFGHLKNIPIAQLQEANLETFSGKDKEISYQVVLLTDENKIPLRWYGDRTRKSYEALTTRINAFVGNPTDTTLTVQQDDREFGYVFFGLGSFLLLLSFLFISIGSTTKCTLEQDSNSFTLQQQRFFGLKNFSSKLALSDIAQARVEYGERLSTSRITLILSTGEKLPLNRVYSSGSKEEIATAIENFLKSYHSQHKPSEKSN